MEGATANAFIPQAELLVHRDAQRTGKVMHSVERQKIQTVILEMMMMPYLTIKCYGGLQYETAQTQEQSAIRNKSNL